MRLRFKGVKILLAHSDKDGNMWINPNGRKANADGFCFMLIKNPSNISAFELSCIKSFRKR